MKTYHMQSLEYNQKTLWSEMQNEIGSVLPKLHFLLQYCRIDRPNCMPRMQKTHYRTPHPGLLREGLGFTGGNLPRAHGCVGVHERAF